MNLVTLNIDLTTKDTIALMEMAEDMSLSPGAVVRQALGMLQLVRNGHSKLVEKDPLFKLDPGVD